MNEKRTMKCDFCGFTCETTIIGQVHCGPHRMPDGVYYPAKPMREIERPTGAREQGETDG